MLRVFISFYLAFNGMFDAVISHQSGTAQAALQVAGASPTVVDQTQEHIVSQLLTPNRVTAAFQGNVSCSGPWKTSCATDPGGGGKPRGRRNDRF